MVQNVTTGAARAVDIDYRLLLPVSKAAGFFHSYPRLRGVAPNTFDISAQYRSNVYLLGVPYVVAAAVLMLGFVGINLFFYLWRGVPPGADDTEDGSRAHRNITGKLYLLLSAFIHVFILLCVGIAAAANATMRQAGLSAQDAVQATRSSISAQLIAPMSMLSHTYSRGSGSTSIGMNIEESVTADDIIRMLGRHKNNFADIIENAVPILDNLDDIGKYIRYLSVRVYFWIAFMLGVCIVGVFVILVSDIVPPRAHKTRIATIIIFAVPLAVSWILIAMVTSLGAATGDFCAAVTEYHVLVNNQAYGTSQSEFQVPDQNIFVTFDLQCPIFSSSSEDLKAIDTFLDSAVASPRIKQGLSLITGEKNPQQWDRGILWIQKSISQYKTCDSLVSLGGYLSFHICGNCNQSAVSAMAIIWIASIGICLLFVLLLFFSSVGEPPAEFSTAQEMMHVYGAPKLITAFGDIDSITSRHDTFNRNSSRLSAAGASLSLHSEIAALYRD